MLPIRASSANEPAPDSSFAAQPRQDGEDNVAWVSRALDELRTPDGGATYVLLVGGVGIYDFRLRVAQSQLRHDMTPSHWSHAAIIANLNRSVGGSRLLETSLDPDSGFGLPSMYNGVQGARLDRYAAPADYPNVALIRVPVDPKQWRDGIQGNTSLLAQFARQRVVVDVPQLILEWLGYVWGAGDGGNPLLRGHGIPAAAVIESLLGAAGYDLCPGLDSSASSPEAFWQTAKWWQDYFRDLNIPHMVTRYHVVESQSPEPAQGGKKATKKAAKKAATAEEPIRGLTNPKVPGPPRTRSATDYTADLFR